MAIKITSTDRTDTFRSHIGGAEHPVVFIDGVAYLPDATPAGDVPRWHDQVLAFVRRRDGYMITTGETQPQAHADTEAAILAELVQEIGTSLSQRWVS